MNDLSVVLSRKMWYQVKTSTNEPRSKAHAATEMHSMKTRISQLKDYITHRMPKNASWTAQLWKKLAVVLLVK